MTTELVSLGGIATDTGCAGCRWVEWSVSCEGHTLNPTSFVSLSRRQGILLVRPFGQAPNVKATRVVLSCCGYVVDTSPYSCTSNMPPIMLKKCFDVFCCSCAPIAFQCDSWFLARSSICSGRRHCPKLFAGLRLTFERVRSSWIGLP